MLSLYEVRVSLEVSLQEVIHWLNTDDHSYENRSMNHCKNLAAKRLTKINKGS
jgi:hypothetical protein